MAKEWLSVAHGHGFGFQKPLLWLPALAPVCGGHEPAMTSHKRLSHKLSPVKHVAVSAQVSPTIIFFSSSLSFRLVMPLFLFKGQFFRYFPLNQPCLVPNAPSSSLRRPGRTHSLPSPIAGPLKLIQLPLSLSLRLQVLCHLRVSMGR